MFSAMRHEIVMAFRILILCLLIYSSESVRVKRVVGGTEVDFGIQPRVTSLRSSRNNHLCGSVLLTRNFAITAAHCVRKPQSYFLRLSNYCETDRVPIATVLEVFVHDLYDMRSGAHDIALLRIQLSLDDAVWLDADILPVFSFGLSGECTIYGYGTSDPTTGQTFSRLHSANVNIVSLDKCEEILGPIAPDCESGMMCAVGNGSDTCHGDSGSPMICGPEERVEGISSYGMSCGVAGVPGVYTSVAAHLDWIYRIMQVI